MQITISFPPGFEVQGVVLSVRDDSMRVAMRDWDDAAVFNFADGHWFSENGDRCRVHTSGLPAGIPACARSAAYEQSVGGLLPLRALAC
jgi:hypothetical protein